MDRIRLDFLVMAVAGSSDGNDSTVSGDVDDDIVLVVASWISSGRIFDLTACADEGDGRDDVDDDEAISLRLRDDRKRKDFRFEFVWFFLVRLYVYNNHKQDREIGTGIMCNMRCCHANFD